MARTPRSLLPDGQFHLIAHAVGKESLFHDDIDRRKFLGLLGIVAAEHEWSVRTFVLMRNHVHLLIDARAATLSSGLWWWHWRFAAHLSMRDETRRGHVFDSRPRTIPVTSNRHSAAVLRYIALNPVAAGVCERPEEYAWSAHRALIGDVPPPPFLDVEGALEGYGSDIAGARRHYEAFVLGTDPPEHARVTRLATGTAERPPVESLLAAGHDTAALREARRWGFTTRELAAATGLSQSTISRRLR